MLAISQEFFRNLRDKTIKTQNYYLDKVVQNFSFEIFTKDKNDISHLLQKTENTKFIIIDKYIEKDCKYEFGEDFYIVCFDYSLIMIQSTIISLFLQFLSQNENITIYCYSNQIKDDIEILFQNIKLNFSEDNDFFNQTPKFIKKISFKHYPQSDKIKNFCTIIEKSLFGFLLMKSYFNSKIDRSIQYDQLFQINSNPIKIEQNEYIKLQGLGIGSASSVFLIYHVLAEKLFSLKIFYNNVEKHKLYTRELDNYNKISHPFFPRFIGTSQLSSLKCLVIEYIEGRTLKDFIKNNEISLFERFKILLEILKILKHIHDNGYIYRDLKSNNIIINRNNQVFIIDFDRMINESSTNNDFTRNLMNTPPEIERNKKYTYQSDIYSLGKKIFPILFLENYLNNKIEELMNKCSDSNPENRPKLIELIDNVYINIGNLYYYGQTVEQDYTKAKHYYELASIIDDSTVLYNLGNIYYYGYGVKQDYLKAKEYFEHSSKLNNSSALIYLGLLYASGHGVKRDYLKAKEYYELSSKQNNSYALNYLGVLYENGYGVKQDYLKAKEFYELSSKLNDSDAFNNLGDLYYYGLGVSQDYLKAKEYYELSSKQCDSDALNSLGNLYKNGHGVKRDYLKAKEYYEQSSKLNNSDAFNNLGDLYYHGFGVDQDYLKAKEFYELSSKLNDSNALNNLGNLYKNGYGVDQDYLKAKEYYEMSSKLNDSNALNNLGDLYYYGHGVKRDFLKAKQYYEMSSKLNDSNALVYLGNIYYYGHGVQQDYLKAKEYYELSSKLNNSSALNNLGNLYHHGHSVQQDYLKAKEYYEMASKKNDPDALYNLGDLYYHGHGVQQDYLKSKEYFELSSKLNDSYALIYLGNLYYYGHGVEQDYSKAKEYYELSSKLNNSSGLCNLGNLYKNGHGVKQNYLKAKKYYELSSKQNNSSVLYNLGNLYYYGYGVEQDYLKAKEYYELSSKLNNSFALNNLGHLYKNGHGVKQDYLKAKEYYELSAKLNDSNAFNNLGDLYYNGQGIQQNYLKAKEYYELSAKLNNSTGLYNLGNLYENGFGVEQDFLKAKKYYELSSCKNYPNAHFTLGKFYSDGDIFYTDINKSIYYYKKCIDIHYGQIKMYDLVNHCYIYTEIYNKYFYHSNNDLGLIYLTVFQDVDNATKYIKEAAFGEYPFGQNNFGLLNELYFNEIGNADYLYRRSSKHHFALAEFNLGHFKEKDNKLTESIDYYIKASQDEDQPLIFHNWQFYDNRLEISKKFIICFTNLKLAEFYFSEENFEESKKYFIKAFSKLISNQNDYKFELKIVDKRKTKKIFEYLKFFILNFPPFNLINQPTLSQEIKEKIKFHLNTDENEQNEINSFDQKEEMLAQFNLLDLYEIKNYKNQKMNNEPYDLLLFNKVQDKEEIVFNDIDKLFEFIISNKDIRNRFIDEIKNILELMKEIIYSPPYAILFGRINIEKERPKEKEYPYRKDINHIFYEGFEQDI